eukprot:4354687-Prymnesium_polylepis.1
MSQSHAALGSGGRLTDRSTRREPHKYARSRSVCPHRVSRQLSPRIVLIRRASRHATAHAP